MKDSARYAKVVAWSGQDQHDIGYALGLVSGGCCHGDDAKAVFDELCDIVDEWIEIFHEDGNRCRRRPPDITTATSWRISYSNPSSRSAHEAKRIFTLPFFRRKPESTFPPRCRMPASWRKGKRYGGMCLGPAWASATSGVARRPELNLLSLRVGAT